jgi:hypothetical protein
MAFSVQGAVRGRTLLPRRLEEGQNRATTSGVRGMSDKKGKAGLRTELVLDLLVRACPVVNEIGIRGT